MRLAIEPMELEDVPDVVDVDRESYALPWPASAYRREILHNSKAVYVVLRQLPEGEVGEPPEPEPEPPARPRLPFPFLPWHSKEHPNSRRPGRLLGYAGMWVMVDEAHITTIAVRSEWRGHGLGELLLVHLIENAIARELRRLTLEVRVSNDVAQKLYYKYAFHQDGVRRRYYSDNNEDAYIMSTIPIQSEEFQKNLDERIDELQRRFRQEGHIETIEPPLPIALDAASVADAE